MAEEKKTLVAFTDGGLRNNCAGWGIHAYDLTVCDTTDEPCQCKVPKNKPQPKLGDPCIKLQNPVKSANYIVNYWQGLEPGSTHNTGEVGSVARILNVCLEDGEYDSIDIRSDAEYVVQGINRKKYEAAAKRGWKKPDGTPTPNAKQWMDVADALEKITDQGIKYNVEWVKAHNGSYGNTKADQMATRGLMHSMEGDYAEHMEQWSVKEYPVDKAVNYSKMLSYKCWYFLTGDGADGKHVLEDGRHVYLMGDHGKDDEDFGIRASDCCLAVAIMKEAEPVLEILRGQAAKQWPSAESIVHLATLRNIFKPLYYNDVKRNKAKYSVINPYTKSVSSWENSKERVLFTKPQVPRMKAAGSLNHLGILLDVLHKYDADRERIKESSTIEINGIGYTEITDKLVILKKDKPVLEPSIGGLVKAVTVDAILSDNEEHKVTATVGQDLPSKNAMSALAKLGTKFFVVTYGQTTNGFRTAVICDDGDNISITSSGAANLVVKTNKK